MSAEVIAIVAAGVTLPAVLVPLMLALNHGRVTRRYGIVTV